MGEQTDTLAANIRAEMGRRQVSQKTLALALGMTQPSVSKRLSGFVPWTLPELARMAEYFDISLAELLDGVAA